MKLIILLILLFLFPLAQGWAEANDVSAQAKELAKAGNYQQAYELLLGAVTNLQEEIKNINGVLCYYKEEVAKLKGEGQQPVVDLAYNKAANRLFASAWRYQHDGVFKKTGKEKEEFLNKAVAVYKRIVIDYPHADKAEEAQYRVGRVYYKFLKEHQPAEVELQRYLNQYPKGRYASDVRSMLGRIKGK